MAYLEFNTDKNRSKDPLIGKSSFAKIALGQTEKRNSDSNQEDLKDRENTLRDKRGEEQEKRDNKSKTKNVQKGLSNLIGSLALSSDKSGVSTGVPILGELFDGFVAFLSPWNI